jgi:type III pantothenate kinase
VLLAVDIGNSTTVVGVFAGSELLHHWRAATVPSRTSDEFLLLVRGLLDTDGIDVAEDLHGAVVGCVVPPVTETVREMCQRYLAVPPVVVEPGVRTGIAIQHDHPKDLGADRIANAVAAHELYGGPAVVVDFGTAISIDAIDRDGRFIGGAIAPGVSTASDAVVERTARLPRVETLTPPSPIGRSTVTALQSGIVYGFAGLVDGLVERTATQLGPGVTTVATGRAHPAVLDACAKLDHHDPWLTLKGLRLIWERNT